MEFKELIDSKVKIKLFGQIIKDVQLSSEIRSVDPNVVLKHFAIIRGTSWNKICVKLPKPIIILVADEGQIPDECDWGSDIKMWTLPKNANVISLDYDIIDVADIEEHSKSKRGINGGVELKNPRIENGKACVTVHAWAEIKVLGKKVGFDETKDVCLSLDQCITIVDIGVGKAEICYRPPNQLCVKACIGKWGLSQCWDKCVTVG